MEPQTRTALADLRRVAIDYSTGHATAEDFARCLAMHARNIEAQPEYHRELTLTLAEIFANEGAE